MNVFKEMGCAGVKPDAYPQFLRNKKGKIFGYGMLLMAFYFVITALIPLIQIQAEIGGIGHAVKEELPDFEVSEYGFWIERPYQFDGGTTYVALNSDDYFDEEEAYLFSQGYQSVLLVDSEKMLIKSNGQVQTLYFYMLESGTYFSRQSIMAFIPLIYLLVILFLIFYFIWITAVFFFGVLIVALLGMILNSITKAGLTFGQIYILGIYGRTWPLFFKGVVVRLFGVHIPFFWVVNFGVTLIYLYLAMRKIGAQRVQNNPYVYVQTPGSYGQDGYGQMPYQQGSYQQGSYQQGPYQQGPYQQGPYQQEPCQQTPYSQGENQSSYQEQTGGQDR